MVQAVDLGAGGDDYFLVLGQFGHDDVGLPNRRHTVDFLDLGFGGGRIHGDGVDTKSRYVYVAVEHAAEYVAAVAVVHPAREGAAKDRSVAAVFHNTLEDAVHDGAAVCHFFLKAAVLYGAFVCHAARKGAVLDGVAVCHFSIEGAVLDVAAVCHGSIEGAVVHDGAVACHSALEDAVLYGAFVCHFSCKDAAGNFHPPLNLNRTRHRLCGTEIIRSTRQSQCLGVFIVTPAGATARDFALVGSLRPALLHNEVGAGDRSVQHHVLVRHGEFYGVLVAVDVVVRADGLAVQAEDFGAGGDGHGGACVGVEVPCRAGRSIRVQRAFVVHLAHTAIRYGDLEGIGQPRLAVEDAAGHAAVVLRQARRENAAGDIAAVVHLAPEGAARDRSSGVVHHRTLKFAAGDFLFVYHIARALEGAVADGAFVFHFSLKGAVRDFSFVVVFHCSFKGAVLNGASVCHGSIEDAVRDCSAEVVFHCSFKGAVLYGAAVVCHGFIEGAAGHFHTKKNHNRTQHSLLGRPSCLGFGIGVSEIILSIIQIQCVVPVPPAVANGADRVAVLHDEVLGGAFCKGPQGEHGEHHAQCQDQAENAFFHRGRPPFLPKTASKSRTVVRF